MTDKIVAVRWEKDRLLALDQRYLPHREEEFVVHDLKSGHEAINVMVVRGAPLIGFTAIWTMALWAKDHASEGVAALNSAAEYLKTARPTAVNLAFEVDRCVSLLGNIDPKEWYSFLLKHADDQVEKLEKDNREMARIGLKALIDQHGDRKFKLVTICNTGRLACQALGTALGVISHANDEGRVAMAYACETRPYLQGGRLTSFEMLKEGIDHKILVEGAMASDFRNEKPDGVFVGADRIARNGDTANKIGTSTLAIIAKKFGVPFYVVAPISSFDVNTKTGSDIPIEERPESEVLEAVGQRIAPQGAKALNPSFDVTPAEDITGIICENGLISPVTEDNLLKVVGDES